MTILHISVFIMSGDLQLIHHNSFFYLSCLSRRLRAELGNMASVRAFQCPKLFSINKIVRVELEAIVLLGRLF
jgi:hypothetical protein